MENQPPEKSIFGSNAEQPLPNATSVLVLGIISIVGCLCYGIVGLACGIIALALASKDMRLYQLMPDMYSATSYNNLKAGRICAIIGTIISGIYLVAAILYFVFWGTIMFNSTLFNK